MAICPGLMPWLCLSETVVSYGWFVSPSQEPDTLRSCLCGRAALALTSACSSLTAGPPHSLQLVGHRLCASSSRFSVVQLPASLLCRNRLVYAAELLGVCCLSCILPVLHCILGQLIACTAMPGSINRTGHRAIQSSQRQQWLLDCKAWSGCRNSRTNANHHQ